MRAVVGPRPSGRGVVDSKFSRVNPILSKFYRCAQFLRHLAFTPPLRGCQKVAKNYKLIYFTGVNGARPSNTSIMFLAASSLIAPRVSSVAEAVCGVSTVFGKSFKPGAISGSFS